MKCCGQWHAWLLSVLSIWFATFSIKFVQSPDEFVLLVCHGFSTKIRIDCHTNMAMTYVGVIIIFCFLPRGSVASFSKLFIHKAFSQECDSWNWSYHVSSLSTDIRMLTKMWSDFTTQVCEYTILCAFKNKLNPLWAHVLISLSHTEQSKMTLLITCHAGCYVLLTWTQFVSSMQRSKQSGKRH